MVVSIVTMEHLSPILLSMASNCEFRVLKLMNKVRVSERKNHHLLEVARTLIFTMHVQKSIWGDIVLTAAFLINRLPSRGFRECKSDFSIASNIYT